MAYDTLKTEIRQYIKTNGANEITGQILQNVLLDMVNAYPSLDGYATQQWVQNQLSDMATMTWVGNNYLPLTGGMINGNLSVFNNLYVGTRLTISAEGGTPEDPESYEFWLDNGEINIDGQTVITRTNITANAFVKNNGTSSQFLKADGSVDNNTYLSSADISG
jgi:hypothetical protein